MCVSGRNGSLMVTFSTAWATISAVAPEMYACNGSSSPGMGPYLIRPILPSFTEPLPKQQSTVKRDTLYGKRNDVPRMMILAPV